MHLKKIFLKRESWLQTLKEESARLLCRSLGHGQPRHRVGAHGFCAEFVLHLGVEGWHGQLNGCDREERNDSVKIIRLGNN